MDFKQLASLLATGFRLGVRPKCSKCYLSISGWSILFLTKKKKKKKVTCLSRGIDS